MTEPLPLRRSRWFLPTVPGSRVTRLELFYDLIFVFAFINVTDLVSRELTAVSLLAGAVVVALLWFSWTGFAVLGNLVRPDHGIISVFGFAIMAAIFVLTVAMPQAFVDQPGDLPGPAVFAAAYLLARTLTVASFWTVLGTTGQARHQVIVITMAAFLAALLVGLSLTVPRWVPADAVLGVRVGLWAAALAVEYAVGLVLPRARWAVASIGHWAERHALIVLIALGEAVIALGLGPDRFDRLVFTSSLIIAAVLGIALIVMLWWLYFDTLAPGIEQAMHGTRDKSRVGLARDVFSYLHLPVITGIVGAALGLELVTETLATRNVEPLPWRSVAVLYGGVALYLLATAVITWRTFRRLRRSNLVAVVIICLLTVPATLVTPVVALGILVAVCGVLALVQRFTGAAARTRIKASLRREERAAEKAITHWRGQHL